MNHQLKKRYDQILKSEIDLIFIYSSAVLEPQSEIAEKLYNTYNHAISEAVYHNHNVSSMTLGETLNYSIEYQEIPSFNEFITSKLSNENDVRYRQQICNYQESFIDIGIDGMEIGFIRFCDNLKLIIQTAHTISKHISTDSYSSADQELTRLIKRFSDYYPKYQEMFEFKPSFFGISIDLVALEKNMSTFISSMRK